MGCGPSKDVPCTPHQQQQTLRTKGPTDPIDLGDVNPRNINSSDGAQLITCAEDKQVAPCNDEEVPTEPTIPAVRTLGQKIGQEDEARDVLSPLAPNQPTKLQQLRSRDDLLASFHRREVSLLVTPASDMVF